MIAVLIALGVIAGAPAGTGDIVVPEGQIATLPALQAATISGSGIPIGAYEWPRAFDPSDRRPYAYDFGAELADGVKIASIDRLTMLAAGAAVGVQIDQTDPRRPIVDTDGKMIQLWFLVDPDQQANAAFLEQGVKVGVAALIRTDEVPFEQIERTAVLTVRQR